MPHSARHCELVVRLFSQYVHTKCNSKWLLGWGSLVQIWLFLGSQMDKFGNPWNKSLTGGDLWAMRTEEHPPILNATLWTFLQINYSNQSGFSHSLEELQRASAWAWEHCYLNDRFWKLEGDESNFLLRRHKSVQPSISDKVISGDMGESGILSVTEAVLTCFT